jgi:hypothetical protein
MRSMGWHLGQCLLSRENDCSILRICLAHRREMFSDCQENCQKSRAESNEEDSNVDPSLSTKAAFRLFC